MIASYLALLMKEDGVSDTEIGLLAIPFSLSLMISNSLSGRLSDYRGRKQFILIGLILSSFSTSFFVFPLNLWTYFLARIFNGIALGIFPSSLIGLASDNNVKLGWLSSFGSIGWAFGGLVGGILADKYSLSFVFVYSSFMYLSAFIMSLFLQDDSEGNKSSRNNSREIFYSQVIRKNWLIYLVVVLRHDLKN